MCYEKHESNLFDENGTKRTQIGHREGGFMQKQSQNEAESAGDISEKDSRAGRRHTAPDGFETG